MTDLQGKVALITGSAREMEKKSPNGWVRWAQIMGNAMT
jgi:hypothetical protein